MLTIPKEGMPSAAKRGRLATTEQQQAFRQTILSIIEQKKLNVALDEPTDEGHPAIGTVRNLRRLATLICTLADCTLPEELPADPAIPSPPAPASL